MLKVVSAKGKLENAIGKGGIAGAEKNSPEGPERSGGGVSLEFFGAEAIPREK
jgi:hypothetical protein